MYGRYPWNSTAQRSCRLLKMHLSESATSLRMKDRSPATVIRVWDFSRLAAQWSHALQLEGQRRWQNRHISTRR